MRRKKFVYRALLAGILSGALALAACGQSGVGTGEAGTAGTGDSSPALETEGEVLDWQGQYDLGIRLLEEGRYEEAIIAFTAAIEIDAKNARAYIGRADAYVLSGDTKENLLAAQADYRMAAELNGGAPEKMEPELHEKILTASGKLADIYRQNSDWESATNTMQTALTICGMSEELRTEMSELGFYVSWSNKRDMWYVMPDNSFVGRMPDSTALVRGGYADGYYITDEERERVLRPAVACLQYILDVCEREQEDWAGPINYSSPEKYLIGGYYMLGELDMVKQTRAFWHQKTGSDWYNPDGYTTETNGNLVQYDESGRPYYANLNPSRGEREVWYEYDENGKLIKVTTEYVSYEDRTGYGTLTHVGSIIREYTYENGRLDHWTETVKDECREASEYSNGTVVNLYQYEYEGDTVTRLFYVDGTLSSTEKFRITEFGVYDYE